MKKILLQLKCGVPLPDRDFSEYLAFFFNLRQGGYEEIEKKKSCRHTETLI